MKKTDKDYVFVYWDDLDPDNDTGDDNKKRIF